MIADCSGETLNSKTASVYKICGVDESVEFVRGIGAVSREEVDATPC